MKPRLFVFLFVAGLLLALGAVAAACGDDEAGFVSVVLDNDDERVGSIVDEETGAAAFTANAGEITFEVHNEGRVSHNLVIIRTDLAADALPFADVNNHFVDEEAAGEKIGEIEEFRGGGAMEVGSFTLTPGRYVLICNLSRHYDSGMFAELTVEV